ncbi:hypothetical protein JCM8208_000873 [Rhodotorula glutinis]
MSSSEPVKPPKVKRKKQPKSNRLVRLPPSILRRIFADIVDADPGTLLLCRGLHDYFLHAVYGSVKLDKATQVKAFFRTLSHRPEFAHLVTTATFSQGAADKEKSPVARGRNVVGPGLGSGQRDGLPQDELDEDDITVNFALLGVLLLCMPNLIILGVFGGKLASVLFAQDLVANPRYPRFTHLVISPGEFAPADVLPSLGRDLSRLSHLRTVALTGFDQHLPVSTLNLYPAHLPPRSLHLDTFDLANCTNLGPEIRHLFHALASGLSSFSLTTSWAYPALLDDLELLPSTISSMSIVAGLYACGSPEDVKAMQGFPDVFAYTASMREEAPHVFTRPLTSALSLPRALTSLKLQGDIVVDKTFDLLLDLPNLRFLSLGAHTEFRITDLITFLHSNRTLKTLAVDVCACAPAPSTTIVRRPRPTKAKASSSPVPPRPKPVWRDGFREEDAQVVVRMCGGRGITVEGSVVCATRSAERSHECRGWCTA